MSNQSELLAGKVERIARMMRKMLAGLPFSEPDINDLEQAASALRLAASAPAGDAVAWRYRDNDMLDGEWFVSEYEPTPGNWDTIEPFYAHPPGPSEPSPSSRSETASERALGQAEVRAGINILLETIAAKFDGWATWDVWRSEAASLVRSFKPAPPPSPDCSGCKPSGVQKEDATRIE